jgi:D-alanine-D-alanine ligase
MLNLPYTSSGCDVSALTFNKYHCNNFVRSLGLNLANSISFTKNDQYDEQEIIDILGLPVFVKPARSGSSVGVTKVKSKVALESAINLAMEVDDRVIIEEFLEGREIDCGVLEYRNELIVLPLTEIVSNNEFFDYEAKYTSGKADEITPPELLEEDLEMEIKATSSLLYNKLGCKGIVRVDYILTRDALYFIEINTVPGLSAASIVPKQADVMGIPISRLFEMTIDNMFE